MNGDHSKLPLELLIKIVSNLSLNHPDERHALLDLALCSKFLRIESQRRLFRSTMGEFWNNANRLFTLHLRFLAAATLDPTRLPSYVVGYAQIALAAIPGTAESHTGLTRGTRGQKLQVKIQEDLWNMTAKVLPLMTNLKTLHFTVALPATSITTSTIFSGCSFQLDTLFCSASKLDESELISTFFPNQRQLRHLVYYGDAKLITNSVCPALESLSADETCLTVAPSLPRLTILRIFRGYSGPQPRPQNVLLEGHERLKYLSVDSYSYLREKTPHGPLGLVLLELGYASNRDLLSIQNLPHLRVLVIGNAGGSDVTVKPVFYALKSLEYIDVETKTDSVYLRFHRPQQSGGDCVVEEITIPMDDQMTHWWQGHIEPMYHQ